VPFGFLTKVKFDKARPTGSATTSKIRCTTTTAAGINTADSSGSNGIRATALAAIALAAKATGTAEGATTATATT
jgi:hypothetical protein